METRDPLQSKNCQRQNFLPVLYAFLMVVIISTNICISCVAFIISLHLKVRELRQENLSSSTSHGHLISQKLTEVRPTSLKKSHPSRNYHYLLNSHTEQPPPPPPPPRHVHVVNNSAHRGHFQAKGIMYSNTYVFPFPI